eukprot:TRINITY_DN7709_c0_g1_i4.p1 TRINITY_DN7709_c0_g1~~TRINITY_DN7709_c0_g1_i4.p1  ORF type:complete len:695 (+),score=156.75 TRINITY_DN7709_c0_g1_i4:1751-3835(+)
MIQQPRPRAGNPAPAKAKPHVIPAFKHTPASPSRIGIQISAQISVGSSGASAGVHLRAQQSPLCGRLSASPAAHKRRSRSVDHVHLNAVAPTSSVVTRRRRSVSATLSPTTAVPASKSETPTLIRKIKEAFYSLFSSSPKAPAKAAPVSTARVTTATMHPTAGSTSTTTPAVRAATAPGAKRPLDTKPTVAAAPANVPSSAAARTKPSPTIHKAQAPLAPRAAPVTSSTSVPASTPAPSAASAASLQMQPLKRAVNGPPPPVPVSARPEPVPMRPLNPAAAIKRAPPAVPSVAPVVLQSSVGSQAKQQLQALKSRLSVAVPVAPISQATVQARVMKRAPPPIPTVSQPQQSQQSLSQRPVTAPASRTPTTTTKYRPTTAAKAPTAMPMSPPHPLGKPAPPVPASRLMGYQPFPIGGSMRATVAAAAAASGKRAPPAIPGPTAKLQVRGSVRSGSSKSSSTGSSARSTMTVTTPVRSKAAAAAAAAAVIPVKKKKRVYTMQERRAAAKVIQAHVRGWLCRRRHGEQLKQCRQRRRVAKELLDTEIGFHDVLQQVIDLIYVPLRCPQRKTDADTQIFQNIEEIERVSKTICQELRDRMSTWHPQKTMIGDIFVRLAPFMKCFTPYCNHYVSAMEQLKISMKSSKFSATVTVAEKLMAHSIESALVTPVQRIPRYRLLLAELLKVYKQIDELFPSVV